MKLIEMRPDQIRDAVRRNLPVLMAAGSVEYHGPHLPVGTDLLIPLSVCETIERQCEVVIAPELPFSPTMEWAAAPEDGEIDFDPEPLLPYAACAGVALAAGLITWRTLVGKHLPQPAVEVTAAR